MIIVFSLEKSQFHAFNVGNIKTVISYLALKEVPELIQLRKNNYFAYEDLIERKKVARQKARYFGQ